MENEIIKSNDTTGLCGTCYRDLPAKIEYRTDGAAYITKTCPVHGYEEAMVERSWKFWDESPQLNPINSTYEKYNRISVIEVTDRCNVQCKHCYHQPNNKIADKETSHVISTGLRQSTPMICLMGAEPTMRDDLDEIIRGLKKAGKLVSIYTNGIRLSDEAYLKKICDAGLDGINISVHNPKYHKAAIWNKISQGIDNALKYKISAPNFTSFSFGQISFTVENYDEVKYAVDKMLWLKTRCLPFNFCIRSPADIGTTVTPDEEIFASDIATWLKEYTSELGINFVKHSNNGSNPYHVAHVLDGMDLQVIHWAGVKSIDTRWMNMGPYAEFVPNTRGTFMLQTILRDGWKKGWWQGQRLYSDSQSNV